MNGLSQTLKRVSCCVVAMLAVLGCGSEQRSNSRAVRSPTLDYQQPTSMTTSGRSLSADRTSPSDKLEQGPRVGVDSKLRPNGTLAPGWDADRDGVTYDERRRVGGATSIDSRRRSP